MGNCLLGKWQKVSTCIILKHVRQIYMLEYYLLNMTNSNTVWLRITNFLYVNVEKTVNIGTQQRLLILTLNRC